MDAAQGPGPPVRATRSAMVPSSQQGRAAGRSARCHEAAGNARADAASVHHGPGHVGATAGHGSSATSETTASCVVRSIMGMKLSRTSISNDGTYSGAYLSLWGVLAGHVSRPSSSTKSARAGVHPRCIRASQHRRRDEHQVRAQEQAHFHPGRRRPQRRTLGAGALSAQSKSSRTEPHRADATLATRPTRSDPDRLTRHPSPY